MSQDVKLTILIPEQLRRQAKAAAALRGVTLSDIIRDALQRFVAESEQTAQQERSDEGRRNRPEELEKRD